MRWTCPHCNSGVSAPDEKVGTTWVFSRCYRCNGTTLVKRAEVALMKVERAPRRGEAVLMTAPISKESSVLGSLEENVRTGRNPHAVHLSAPLPPEKSDPTEANRPSRRKLALPILAGATGFALSAMAFVLSAQPVRSAPKTSSPHADRLEVQAAAPARVFAPTPNKNWIRIGNGGANVFGGPGLSFPITGSLLAGRRYEIVERNDQWLKIRVEEKPERVGWVRSDLVL